ncbi:MAG: hypothetical protein JO345_23220 [Streptosporangiaceae bacterium]|nr:hypothetical protein [Streptosporangiaceae bacterium]
MPTPDPEPRSALSRRSVLRRAAGAGAAGLAVTALGTSAFEATTAASAASPIIVHVRDAASGDIEVFAGTSQARLRDRDLAIRIARAIS